MPKNIVICCDGTNNTVEGDLTNVGRIYRIAARVPDKQHLYYDVGVGVEAPGMATRLGATVYRWAGLAFGVGLIGNVVEAYRELSRTFQPGDQVFLFGFSRGAYTVRVLAGLLEHYGLLTAVNASEANAVVDRYRKLFPKEGSNAANDEAARKEYLARTFAEAATIRREKSVDCRIHFMGLWDTVSSVGWAHDPKHFPSTARLPNVDVIRHAIALDERRAKFRTNRVTPVDEQDVREVWFPGVHADVGGGYPEAESGPARVSLAWMLREAESQGLLVDAAMRRAVLDGAEVPPDENGPQHESLKGFWWPLEYWPLPYREQVDGQWVERKIRYRGQGWRRIRKGDLVHESLRRREVTHPVRNANWNEARGGVVWVP